MDISRFRGLPLQQQPYFHGPLTREESNHLLQREGDFLVRKGDRSDTLALSCFTMGEVKHFLIEKNEKGLWNIEDLCFQRIPNLIEYYYTNKTPIFNPKTKLERPVTPIYWKLAAEKRETPVQNELGDHNRPLEEQNYYHGFETVQAANISLQREGDFLVQKQRQAAATEVILSCYSCSGPAQIPVNQAKTGFWKTNGAQFRTIPELIKYYFTAKASVNEAYGAVLRRPIPREDIRNEAA